MVQMQIEISAALNRFKIDNLSKKVIYVCIHTCTHGHDIQRVIEKFSAQLTLQNLTQLPNIRT